MNSQHIRDAYTHIQMSDAGATDSNIIAALEEIIEELRDKNQRIATLEAQVGRLLECNPRAVVTP